MALLSRFAYVSMSDENKVVKKCIRRLGKQKHNIKNELKVSNA